MKILPVILLALFISVHTTSQILPVRINPGSKDQTLSAKFYPAMSAKQAPTIILLHGFPGNENSPLGLAEELNRHEMNILVFNYQGTFSSDGIFNFDHCQNDLVAAIDFLKQPETIRQFAIDTSRIIICGYSFGGSIALVAAIHHPEIKNIISIAGGNDQAIYLKRMSDDPLFRKHFEENIIRSYSPGGPIKGDSAYLHTYFDTIIPDVSQYDLIRHADTLKNRKILFIVGWMDTSIPMEEYILPVYRQLKFSEAENVCIKAFNTDHSFGNVREELILSIVEWSRWE